MYLEMGGAAQKTSIMPFSVVVLDVRTMMSLPVEKEKKEEEKHVVEEKRTEA